VRPFAVAFLICGCFAAAPAATSAAPPAPPPGCAVVVDTPAAVTGSDTGFAQKGVTFDRLCVPG
jgi:hypothetical protein